MSLHPAEAKVFEVLDVLGIAYTRHEHPPVFTVEQAERLQKYLGLEPGSVSPFGLINDRDKEVIVIVDQDLKQAGCVNFHPNLNTVTVGIGAADFERYLAWTRARGSSCRSGASNRKAGSSVSSSSCGTGLPAGCPSSAVSLEKTAAG